MTFRPTGYGEKIFKERYAATPEETWEQACMRVARHVSGEIWTWRERGDSNPLLPSFKFYEEMVNGRFMPGGRIWYGSGRPQGQLLNCFVVPATDSIEGWAKVVGEVMIITAKGGGVGVNLSPIRGRGAHIKSTGGQSTGSVSLADMINMNGEIIKGGGGRRLALMLDLDITHPDMPEFLDAKLEEGRLNNANISLVLSMDPHEFVRKVRNNESIDLEFGGQLTGKSVNARDLMERIVLNAWTNGEPGILNKHLANEQNNIYYHKELVSTNPCGEIWLEEYGCCDLGALVLPRFVRGGTMDWEQLRRSIRVGVEFLDDVLDVNNYPLPEIEKNCKELRRIGLGVMGVHNMLLELGMKYSSYEALSFLDELFRFLKREAYLASVDLAKRKGPFPLYSPRFLGSGFMHDMDDDVYEAVAAHGIRNCALLTIAPTGTTSIVHGVASGIEPLYAPVHIRTNWVAQEDGSKRFDRTLVVDPMFEKYPDLCEGAMDLTPAQHFAVQKVVQAHIDNAVSKTINLPKDMPLDGLMEVWLEYLPYCKGTTLYRDGSRVAYDDEGNPFQPLEAVPVGMVAEAMRAYGYVVEDDQTLQNSMDCVGGTCEVSWAKSEVELEMAV